MTSSKGLTPKQERFCEEYIRDLNSSAAYRRAGYNARGNAAEAAASRLLSDVKVAAVIATAMKARSKRTQVTADRVLKELARVAFLDIGNAFTSEGGLKPINEMDEDTRRAVAGIEVNELRGENGDVIGTLKKIKIADKLRALELLGRHLGLFDDRLKLSSDVENPLSVLIRQVQGTTFKPVAKSVPNNDTLAA